MKQRFIYKYSGENLEIVIKSDWNWFLIYLISLLVWFFIGLFCLYFLTACLLNCFIVIIAVLIWSVVFVFLYFLTYWHLAGNEIIVITPRRLIIERTILFDFKYVTSYDIDKISNLGLANIKKNLLFGCYHFSFKNKTVYPGFYFI